MVRYVGQVYARIAGIPVVCLSVRPDFQNHVAQYRVTHHGDPNGDVVWSANKAIVVAKLMSCCLRAS